MIVVMSGGSGFVGKNLSAFFKVENYILENLSLRDTNWNVSLDNDADVLIHLAGKAHDNRNASDDSEYYSVNTDLSKELFNQFLVSNIKDFIFFSSVKAAADSVEGVLDETNLSKPLTSYGKSKKLAEDYLLSTELPEGKRLFIVRPCMIHGPGNKGNLNLLYNVVKKGIPWPLASFENERSFVSIDNVCYLVNQIISNSEIESGIYNLADDDPISTNRLIEIIAEETNQKKRLMKVPVSLIKGAASIGDKLSFPLNSERLQKLTESYVVSNAKIKRALGIGKLPLTAEEGLRKTIRSFNKSK